MRNKAQIILISILSFITLLVILSSVIFSVQHVEGYCYNEYDPDENEQIISYDTNGLKKGKSIFLLDEDKIISNVESKVTNIKIVNIERKFPNRICINYVKLYEYMNFTDGEYTYYLANNGKIVKQIENCKANNDDTIKLITNSELINKTQGDYLKLENKAQTNAVIALLSALERFKFDYALSVFDSVDVSFYNTKSLIFLKTKTGVVMELQGSYENILDKLQAGISLYEHDENTYKQEGTIIVDNSSMHPTYSKKDRYSTIK